MDVGSSVVVVCAIGGAGTLMPEREQSELIAEFLVDVSPLGALASDSVAVWKKSPVRSVASNGRSGRGEHGLVANLFLPLALVRLGCGCSGWTAAAG